MRLILVYKEIRTSKRRNILRNKLNKIKPINFVFLTFAGIINAVAVTLFLQPAMLYDGGLSGTSMLLSNLSGWSVSIFLLVLNFFFFIIGYKKLGFKFIVYSLYAKLMFSLFSFLIQDVIPFDFSNGSPITKDDMLLGAIFGGIISGIGSGLTIRFGGAIDGIEVMSLIFAKKLGMTIGTFVMSYNIILYVIAGAVTNSWITPLYSLIAYAAGLKSVDFIIEGFDKSKSAFIISNEPEKIADTLVDIFERGVTIINAEGYYSKKPKKILYCVVNRFEVNTLKTIVTDIDPKAFVAITEVSDSMGSSLKFNKLRERKKNKRKRKLPVVTTVENVVLPDEILQNLDTAITEQIKVDPAFVETVVETAVENATTSSTLQSANKTVGDTEIPATPASEKTKQVVESQIAELEVASSAVATDKSSDDSTDKND